MSKKLSLILVLLLIGAMGYSKEIGRPFRNSIKHNASSLQHGANLDTPFDPNEVIEKVSRHRRHEFRNPNPESRNPGTGEFLIDTSIVYVPTPYNQRSPSVAFDGTNYLVVWQDERSGSYDIYGARVNQAGTVLDPAGIPISTAVNSQWSPSVAFDGTNYLVVWEDYRNNPDYSDIYGARVNQFGTVLDPNGIPISTAADDQYPPSIAFDGTNYLVVWEDWRNNPDYSDIYGARVNQAGTVLDPTGIPISTAVNSQWSPSIAFDGTDYLVVWEDCRSGGNSDIYGARINQVGVVLDPAGIPISTAANWQWFPSVAFDGTDYLVVWQDERSGPSDIYSARVNPAGVVLDPNGIPISTAADDQYSPSVIFDGTNYLVVWEDRRSGDYSDIYGARVNQAGTVLDPAGIPISTAANWQWFPSVAFDGTDYLVVWEDWRSGAWDIYGARVNQAGTVLDPAGILISTAANWQSSPSVAFDGTNYLVVWEDWRRGSDRNIYGARVNQVGTLLDPNGIPISTAANHQRLPSVAFDGTNYLVVWTDSRSGSYDIYGARVNEAGVVLDPAGIPISTAANTQFFPSVAFDGTNYFVVWQDGRSGYFDIYGARVNQAGTVLDPAGISISTAAYDQSLPSVAFDGTNYLVVWEDWRSGSSDIYGARVNPAGVVLDPYGMRVSTAGAQWHPSVAFDGTNYLVVWEDWRSGSDWDIYGARVNQAGTVLDPNGIPISTAAYDQWLPSLAFDGTNYLVVWEDGRSGYESDIYGAKVNLSGVVIDSFPVITQIGNQFSPALACGAATQGLITYSGWAGVVQGKAYNAMRIWGKLGPFSGIEEQRTTLDAKRFTPEIYPNPMKSVARVRIPFSTKELKVYDITGKLVKLFSFPAVNEISWDGTDDYGRKLPAGAYLYCLKTSDGLSQTKELIILR